jgi:hypothetical protein
MEEEGGERMEKPITCKYFGNHLDAYLDSELDRETRLKMELHADRCPECGEKLEYMTRLLIMCAEMDEGLSVPLEAQAAWRAAIRESKPTAPRKYPVARWVGGIAAALVLLIGGTFTYRMGGQSPADFIAPNAPVMKAAPAYYALVQENEATLRLAADGEAEEVRTVIHEDIARPVMLRSAERRLETEDLEAGLQGIADLVDEYEGYFEQSTVDEDSAQLTVRVPTQDLDAFLSALDAVGTVTFKNDGIEDISDRFYDARARLDSYRVQLKRLDQLMGSAGSLEDMAFLEDKRTEVLQVIDSLEGQLAGWEGRVEQSTVYVTLAKSGAASPGDLGQRVKAAFGDALEWFKAFCQDALVVLVRASPALVLLVPLVILICLIVWAVNKRKRQKKQ